MRKFFKDLLILIARPCARRKEVERNSVFLSDFVYTTPSVVRYKPDDFNSQIIEPGAQYQIVGSRPAARSCPARKNQNFLRRHLYSFHSLKRISRDLFHCLHRSAKFGEALVEIFVTA